MEGWSHRAAQALAYAPALAAVLVLLAGTRGWWRGTLGRRRDKYERIARLGTNAHFTFFTTALGEAPAMHATVTSNIRNWQEDGTYILEPKAFLESIWIDRDFYVHAYSDELGTVVAFSVTTRSRRFHPQIRSPGYYFPNHAGLRGRADAVLRRFNVGGTRPLFALKLGQSRFAELDQPQMASAWVGAHNVHYYEAHWYGNPGNYQWYIFSINDAGWQAWDVPLIGTLMPSDGPWDFEWGFDGEKDASFDAMSGWHDFRRRTRMNTYTVLSPMLSPEDYPTAGDLHGYPVSFGPNSTQVRTLP
jgi:hypothetical protein